MWRVPGTVIRDAPEDAACDVPDVSGADHSGQEDGGVLYAAEIHFISVNGSCVIDCFHVFAKDRITAAKALVKFFFEACFFFYEALVVSAVCGQVFAGFLFGFHESDQEQLTAELVIVDVLEHADRLLPKAVCSSGGCCHNSFSLLR